MSVEEKDLLQRIAEGMNALPEPEQKYILGFAEGALAASKRCGDADADSQKQDSA